MSEIKVQCQICGLLVDDKDFHRVKLNENFVCGHKACLEKRRLELGLNESAEAAPKKTNILFED